MPNKTFEIVTVTNDRKVVESKWVHCWKANSEGEVIGIKDRLIAKGFRQATGVDVDETLSSTPHSPSVRLVATIAVQQDLDLFRFDAQQAFIQSDPNEEVYMRLPPGRGNSSSTKVRHFRGLCEVKKIPRKRNSLLVSTLQKYSFEQCVADRCVLRLVRQNQVSQIMAVHVDGMIVSGKVDNCNPLCQFLNQSFPGII